MPYIKQNESKKIFDVSLDYMFTQLHKEGLNLSPGDLNYIFTKLIIGYLKEHKLSYKTINDIVGALECCKHEFLRRVVDGYEDKKIIENGDVYPVEFKKWKQLISLTDQENLNVN